MRLPDNSMGGLPVQQTQVEMPIGNYGSIMSFAIELSKDIPMRTLDLLHISYAHTMMESTKTDIELITRDREFEIYKSEIYRAAGIKVMYFT